MASIKEFLSKRLRLKVNETKSGVARVSERQFLGFRLLKLGQIGISEKSQQRVKDTVRRITKRNRGVSLEQVITDLNKHLKGWINYFKLADTHSKFHSLDGWIRRKLRCYRLKQRKKKYPIATFLMGLGLSREEAWKTAGSGKGWWKLSSYLSTHRGMSTAWFKAQGLISLAQEATLVRV